MGAPSTSSFSHCNSNDSLPTRDDNGTLIIHPSDDRDSTRRSNKTRISLHDSEATSSHASHKVKGLACKRRNPRVPIHRKRIDVAAIGFPLGMSFAAVMADVLYKRDVAADRISPTHISLICTSAIKESLVSVFGDKLDGLTRNFEQSFASTLNTLRLIYESTTSNEGDNFSTMKMEVPTVNLTLDKGNCSRDSVTEDGNSEAILHEESQDQSYNWKELEENFHMDSVGHGLTLHRQSNHMVCFPPGFSGSVINSVEKSVMEQSRSNDLKTLELALTMKKLKLRETQLALNSDLNYLERSKLAMGMSKASFKVEKFKNQLEDLRHGELNKKCIDCLIAGLLVMCFSLLYGAYVYSYERIVESTASCRPSTKRSTTTSQAMPVTFILLLLGVACGYCGKLCVDTLGGSGSLWLLYWEILCMLHFLSMVCTPILFQILHGPVTAPQNTKRNIILPYWIRRFLFYATLLMFLPLFCGLTPFASLGQWKDHFLLKVSAFNRFERKDHPFVMEDIFLHPLLLA